MTVRLLFVVLFVCLSVGVQAEGGGPWCGKRCAVCLTYDDALNVHLDNVVPLLDSLGLRATFYISGFFPSFKERMTEWRSVAKKGNELGNHTFFHPCEGSVPGRAWVRPERDLSGYTAQRLVDEIEMAGLLLKAIDGMDRRTFAYPCGDTTAGDSSYVERIRERFVAARGVEGTLQKRADVDLHRIGAFMVGGQSGDELIALVEKALEDSALLVFLFHGVGGEHSLNVSLQAHSQLLNFLKAHADHIWVAPLRDIAEELKRKQ